MVERIQGKKIAKKVDTERTKGRRQEPREMQYELEA